MRGIAAVLIGLLVAGSAIGAEPIPGFAPKDLSAQHKLEKRFRGLLAKATRETEPGEIQNRFAGSDWPDQEIEITGPGSLARALTLLSRKGWRPRRTVLVAEVAPTVDSSATASDPAPGEAAVGEGDARHSRAEQAVRARIRVASDAGPDIVADSGLEVLRLASAALPWRDHAATIETALADLDELAGEASGAFDGNPPPTRMLREALGEARRAARGWESASVAWLERVGSLRTDADREAAGRASVALLSTPASVDLDPARQAVADVNRGALTAALLSASLPARAISTRPREAVAALEPAAPVH